MINISISTNMLILLSCLILFVIIGIIAFIIYKDKKNDQAEIDELIDDIVKAKPRSEEIQVTKIEPKEKVDLEAMLNMMQNDLDKKNANPIESFEKDQEENAIISYKELVKAAEEKRAATQLFEKDQEENAIISYKEIESKNSLEELMKKEELIKPINKAIAKIESPRENKDKKFKNTEFISPIYGKMDEHLDYPKVRSFNKHDDLSLNSYFGEDVSKYYQETPNNNEVDVNRLSDQLKKNDEFLRALKEFRSNL